MQHAVPNVDLDAIAAFCIAQRVVEQYFGVTDMDKHRREAPPIGIDGRIQRIAGTHAVGWREHKLTDDQLIAVMDRAMQSLSTTLGGLSRATIHTPIRYYGQSTLPRVATTYTVNDLHEHLGQLVAYARMNRRGPGRGEWMRASLRASSAPDGRPHACWVNRARRRRS